MRVLATARAGVALLVAACILAPPPTRADEPYPARLVKVVVPHAAGSTIDVVARLIADPLGARLGAPVVIDNRPGASGVLGTTHLVRSPNDGGTIGVVSSNHVINPSISDSVPFNSIADITAISVLGTVPLVLVVSSKVAATNLQELIALAKREPGSLNYGSAGAGSALHFAGVLLASEAGIDIRHVPYRDQNLLISDLRAGRMDISFLSITIAHGHVRTSAVRPIGVSTPARVPLMPDVPSLAEAGLPNYSFDAWIVMIGPAALPKPVVGRLYKETKAVLGTRPLQDAFATQGLTSIGSDPETSTRFLAAELVKHQTLARRAGVKGN